jgi:hypothetical protein
MMNRQFAIRTVIVITAFVALGFGWIHDRRTLSHENVKLRATNQTLEKSLDLLRDFNVAHKERTRDEMRLRKVAEKKLAQGKP